MKTAFFLSDEGTKKMKKKTKKREEFNDLLIPVLLMLCVLPFVIHLAEYSCGYAKYPWYSDNDVITDIYSYYRCYFLEVVAVFTLAVLVFRMGLYKEKRKPCKIFIPAAVYSVMALLSTIFSVNISASLAGNFYQFQGIIVLLGYVVLGFYCYQIMEKESDYKTIWYGVIFVAVLMMIVGFFQAAKKDLLDFSWMQKLIMSKEQYEIYGGSIETIFTGNNVFLTLFNPNYASVFLVMFFCVFSVMFYTEKIKWKKILEGIASFGILILIWFTYSRSAIIAILAAGVIFLALEKEKAGKILKYMIPGIAVLAVVFFFIDKGNDFKYLSRLIDEKKETQLEEMITTKEGVELTCQGKEICLSVEDGKPVVSGKDKKSVEIESKEDGEIILGLEQPIHAMVQEDNLYLWIEEQTFTFGWGEEGYYYLTENGKKDALEKIDKVDFGGLEYLGSGRLYIWSRTIPILNKYLFLGSGPDTFAEVFPQDDYVGKAVYAENPARIMEKPHNDYLLQWVQTGFVSMAAMVVFYILFFRKGFGFYKKAVLDSYRVRLGMGCFLGCISYMMGSFFNDSTLYTAPVFWIFLGISLSVSYEERV